MARGLAHRRENSARAKRRVPDFLALAALSVTDRAAGRHAETPAPCWMCGSRHRRFGTPTLHQRRVRLTVE